MLVVLMSLAAAQPGTDSVLARAKEVAARLADTGAARAQGYGPIQVRRIVDLTPFQGQHWLHRWHLFNDSAGLDAPSFVMFVPKDGTWRPAGLAYSRQVVREDEAPKDLAGVETPWHLHQPCVVVPGEGAALADGEADCRARGGWPRPPQIAMVHAWTGIPNPEGPYAHDNVSLPYWVTGLELPRRGDVATPAKARRTRALGLALGESYGAIMPYARLVEHASMMPALADSLEARRALLRSLVPQLRAAEQAGRRGEWNGLVDRAIREWEALRRIYAAAAPSPAVKAQLERQHALALGETAEGHHH